MAITLSALRARSLKFGEPQLVGLRYGVALTFVAVALLFSFITKPFFAEAHVVLFLAAVIAAGWYCLRGPALFAVVASIVAVDYYFIPPVRALTMRPEGLPYFFSFFLCALVASLLSSVRKRVETERQAHLDELFEQAPEAIMLLDTKARILRINKEFTRIFGYDADEIQGKAGMSLIVPHTLRQEANATMDRLRRGERMNLETIRKTSTGDLLHVSELAFPITVRGERIGDYLIYRDITEKRHAAEALQKSQLELTHLSRVTTMGELVVSIAHEVNQPITAISANGGAARRLLDQDPSDIDEIKAALDGIVNDAGRAGAVISRIRALTQKHPPQMMRVDLNEIIVGTVKLIENQLRTSGIDLRMKLDPGMRGILGDQIQLQQVLMNLMMNSIDAMGQSNGHQKELLIETDGREQGVELLVGDSGPGIREEDIKRIFEPFFTTKSQGIGMGLAISRSIVEAHGGKLWTYPSAGSGARFYVRLPAYAEG